MKAELQLALKSYPRGETSRAHVPQSGKRRQDLTCFIVGLICSSIREAPPTLFVSDQNQRWPRWPRRRAFSPVFARAARPLCAFPRLRATQNRPLRVALSHSRLLQNFGLTPPPPCPPTAPPLFSCVWACAQPRARCRCGAPPLNHGQPCLQSNPGIMLMCLVIRFFGICGHFAAALRDTAGKRRCASGRAVRFAIHHAQNCHNWHANNRL